MSKEPTLRVRGQQIKLARESLKLSQVNFAKLFGFHPRVIQGWEQERAFPDTAANSYLRMICHYPMEMRDLALKIHVERAIFLNSGDTFQYSAEKNRSIKK